MANWRTALQPLLYARLLGNLAVQRGGDIEDMAQGLIALVRVDGLTQLAWAEPRPVGQQGRKPLDQAPILAAHQDELQTLGGGQNHRLVALNASQVVKQGRHRGGIAEQRRRHRRRNTAPACPDNKQSRQ